jgi:hypothetical protein
MAPPTAASFLPSRHGFAFDNSWPPEPAVRVRTPIGAIGIGNAARGLCGGMVFAALDYWHAGRRPPADRPAAALPLYHFIVRRLVRSWHIPAGVATYYRWMLRSDSDVAHRTVVQQWPRVQALLDRGQPAALGVVTVASANPLLLGHNHQVLAYGYRRDGAHLTVAVYDPNSGPDDRVFIRFDAAAAVGAAFAHNVNIGWPLRGFFLTGYASARPPAD